MTRIILIISLAIICACNQGKKSNSENLQGNSKSSGKDAFNGEYKLTTRFNSFDTTVDVLFMGTRDSIGENQKKNFEGFVSRQDMLTPEILKKVFEYYKSSYPIYRKGWTSMGEISDKELEKYLPSPTTPENLKQFITPVVVHIQNENDCEEGTMGIEFDCTWDIENGLGLVIKNWQVKEAGFAQLVYF